MKHSQLFFSLLIFLAVKGNSQPRTETIFLQTDQPAYVAGSGMNIKAWIFLGDWAREEFANLYVNLLNAKQEVISSTILPVWRGHSSGGLMIPPGTAEAVYYLHAYTNKTKISFGQYGHVIPVPVLNAKLGEKLVWDSSFHWRATAHVEGGQLLAGLSTRVVVRMVSDVPISFGWSAEVRNSAGQVVTALKEKDENIALGWMTPVSGETYTAFVRDHRGVETPIALPPVRDAGTFLQVNVGAKNVRCVFLLRGISASRAPFTVRGIQHGEVVYTGLMENENMGAVTYIPVSTLDRGTLYLEVKDVNGILLADRVCYVPSAPSKSIQVLDSLKTPTSNRALQTFRIRAMEEIPWFFAHARAVDDSRFEEQDNLFSRLYLSSLSQDPFFRPARYFRGDSLLPLLDVVHISLVDSYRKEMQQPDSTGLYTQDSLLSFTGLAYDPNGPRCNQEINLIIQNGNEAGSFRQVMTDSAGRFRLDNLAFVDSAKVFYQINGGKNRDRNDVSISLKRTEGRKLPHLTFPRSGWISSKIPEERTETHPLNHIEQAMSSEQALAKNYKTLEEVRVTATRQTKASQLDRELSSVLFRSEDDKIIDLVNDHPEGRNVPNIFAYVRDKLPPMVVYFQNGEYLPYFRGQSVTITIDEIRSDPQMVKVLNPAEIAMVKFQRYNVMIGGPVVAIYTQRMKPKPGDLDNIKGMNFVYIQGYGKEFPRSTVNYQETESVKLKKDNRISLFWKYILPADDQKFMETLRFFRNDTGKPYWLTVAGIRENGVPVILIDRPF
jgi:hypothetical protein